MVTRRSVEVFAMVPRCIRELITLCLLAELLGLAGCATPVERGDETRWQPQLLYLNRFPYSSLYVEVSAVAGTEPSDAALDQLRGFLTTYCDKPAGIRIVRDHPIPRSQAALGFSPDALASRYLVGPPANETNPVPAFMFILYYDSSLWQRAQSGQRRWAHKQQDAVNDFHWANTIPPRSQRIPFPGAIFIDRRYLARWPRSFDGLSLMHEAGHLLGLVQNEKHAFHDHCTNQRCLMRARLTMDLPDALFSRQKSRQTKLCKMCQADLIGSKSEPTPTNLVFLGPVLVRSEARYSVATLPGQLTLFCGELAAFDPSGFLKQSQEYAGRPEVWKEPDRSTHAWWYLHEPRADWARQATGIEQAETDKLELARQAATNSVPVIQYLLGRAYVTGEGLPKDEREGFKWVRKSAASGYAPGQDLLGGCFAEGKGVPTDNREAFNWYRKAADQDLPEAQNHLGVCYEHGDGVAVNWRKAMKCYRKAAEGGDVDGQRNLGCAFAHGVGTHVDLVKAYAWLSVAAQQGDEPAQAALDGLTNKLSPNQVERAQRQAATLSKRGAGKSVPVEESKS